MLTNVLNRILNKTIFWLFVLSLPVFSLMPAMANESWLPCIVLTSPDKEKGSAIPRDTPGTDNDLLGSQYSDSLAQAARFIQVDLMSAMKRYQGLRLPAPVLEKSIRHSSPPDGCRPDQDSGAWEAYIAKIVSKQNVTSSRSGQTLAFYVADESTIYLPAEYLHDDYSIDVVTRSSAPHELFHAVHQRYASDHGSDITYMPRWIREGIAEMAAMDWLKEAPQGKWEPTSRGLGLRFYDAPLHRPRNIPEQAKGKSMSLDTQPYMTSSFWRYIRQRAGGWEALKSQLSRKLNCGDDIESEECEQKSLAWLDAGPSGKESWLFEHYPRFLAYFSETLEKHNRVPRSFESCPEIRVSPADSYRLSSPFQIEPVAAICNRVIVENTAAGKLTIEVDPAMNWQKRKNLHLVIDNEVHRFPDGIDPGPIASPFSETISQQNHAEIDLGSTDKRSFMVMVANVGRVAKFSRPIPNVSLIVHLEGKKFTTSTSGAKGEKKGGTAKYQAARLGRDKSGQTVPAAGENLDAFGSSRNVFRAMTRTMVLNLLPLKDMSTTMGTGPGGLKLMTLGQGTHVEIQMPFVPLGETGTFPAAIVLTEDDGSRFGKIYKGIQLAGTSWDWSGSVTLEINSKERMRGHFTAPGIDVHAMNDANIDGPYVSDEARVELEGQFDLVWGYNEDPDPAILATDNLGMGTAQGMMRTGIPGMIPGIATPSASQPASSSGGGECNVGGPECPPSDLEKEYRELVENMLGGIGSASPDMVDGMISAFRSMSPDMQRQSIEMMRQ